MRKDDKSRSAADEQEKIAKKAEAIHTYIRLHSTLVVLKHWKESESRDRKPNKMKLRMKGEDESKKTTSD